jgi:hypothetical protein
MPAAASARKTSELSGGGMILTADEASLLSELPSDVVEHRCTVRALIRRRIMRFITTEKEYSF